MKQLDNSFRFSVYEHVTSFFTYLHGLVEDLLNPKNIITHRGEVILQCLSYLAKNDDLRQKWMTLVPNSRLEGINCGPTKVVTFFVYKI